MDSLNQLTDCHYFYHKIEQEWQNLMVKSSPLSLIVCDIDCFNIYNEMYGKVAEDDCIKQTNKVIYSCVQRRTDVIDHYGEGKFAIILPNTYSIGAFQLADKIRDKIKSLAIEFKLPYPFNRSASVVTASLGVASIVEPNTDIAALITAANQALYLSKWHGRDRVTLNSV